MPAEYPARPLWLAGVPQGAELDSAINARLARDLPLLGGAGGANKTYLTRYRSGLLFLLPTLALALGTTDLRELAKLKVLEIGCGEGSKSLGLGPFFGEWTGIDPDTKALANAASLARRAGLDASGLRAGTAADTGPLLQKPGYYNAIVLYAVVEHLTIAERLDLLRRAWQGLARGGVLLVAELPNRLAPIDYHSTYLPFFDALPDELALTYSERVLRPDFRPRVLEAEDRVTELYRFGRGASFHEFELALGDDYAGSIISGGWGPLALNQFPLRTSEMHLQRQFNGMRAGPNAQVRTIPAGFSRYWLDFVFRKGATQGPPPVPRLPVPPVEDGGPQRMADKHVIEVAPAARTLSIGLTAASMTGNLQLTDGEGRTLFAARSEELRRATAGHWSPVVTITVPVAGTKQVRIATPGGSASIAYAVFR